MRNAGWLLLLGVPSSPDGDVWRMDFSRFNMYREAKLAEESGGWASSAPGIWDSHVPELFPHNHFSARIAGEAEG